MNEVLTFCLNLVALGKSEVGGKEIETVRLGHGGESGGALEGRDEEKEQSRVKKARRCLYVFAWGRASYQARAASSREQPNRGRLSTT